MAQGQRSYSWPLTDPWLQLHREEITLSTVRSVHGLTDCSYHLTDLFQFSFLCFSPDSPCPSLALIITLFITSRRNRDPAPSVTTAHADSFSHMHGFLNLTQSRGLLYCNRFNIPQMSQPIYTHATVDGMIYCTALIDFPGFRDWLV